MLTILKLKFYGIEAIKRLKKHFWWIMKKFEIICSHMIFKTYFYYIFKNNQLQNII